MSLFIQSFFAYLSCLLWAFPFGLLYQLVLTAIEVERRSLGIGVCGHQLFRCVTHQLNFTHVSRWRWPLELFGTFHRTNGRERINSLVTFFTLGLRLYSVVITRLVTVGLRDDHGRLVLRNTIPQQPSLGSLSRYVILNDPICLHGG